MSLPLPTEGWGEMINSERLVKRIEALSQIGLNAQTGGINRFSFTEEEREANRLITSYMKEAGMTVTTDAVGNVIGQLGQGKEVIMLGSHIDTVPEGGRFDGALGVLAAIEVVQSLVENCVSFKKTVKVVAFKDEEGTRFGFGLIGSKAMAGLLTAEQLQKTDAKGTSIAQAMAADGLDPARIQEAEITPIAAYLEMHIEQGKVLENVNAPVGIVTGISGPLWLEFTVEGVSEHAGATPMPIRQDALVGASEMIVALEQLMQRYVPAVATVGKLQVEPNGINVIPGKVTFSVDLRDIDAARIEDYEQQMMSTFEEIAKRRKLVLHSRELQRVAPAQSAASIQKVFAQCIEAHAITPHYLVSGAGHDAMFLANKAPMGMLFVRSEKGISHNPLEFTASEDIDIATRIFYDAVLLLLG